MGTRTRCKPERLSMDGRRTPEEYLAEIERSEAARLIRINLSDCGLL